jgi:parvulin-like peptidyl-prolyl isomerase
MRMKMSKEYQATEAEKKIETIKTDLLERLIEDRLILQEAKKNKISVDESRLKAKISEIKQHYPTAAEFQNELKKQGLVQADIETKIREQMLMYNIIEQSIRRKIIVRPDEVTSFYIKNRKEFTSPEERNLEVITVENREVASTVFSSLKNGEKQEDLAAKYNITADKLKVTDAEELRKDIQNAVFKLNISEVSDPISIDGKYYIFKLDNIIPSRNLPLSEVQDKIHNYIFEIKMQEELTKWLDELKKQSYIKITQS